MPYGPRAWLKASVGAVPRGTPMTSCLAALMAGLAVGGIVGAWLGAAGRIWVMLFREWERRQEP